MSLLPVSNCKQTYRILIVDDHPILREGLATLISVHSDLKICGEAGDISSALQLVTEQCPDVVIVDISLRNENGLDLVRRLKADNHAVQVLVLSMYDDVVYGERALSAGAMGYLNKHVACLHLVAAIRRILSGKLYVSDELTERMLACKSNGKQAGQSVGFASLTNRELEVFQFIGMGLSTVSIASRLHLSVKTIETYRQNIKRKLGIETSAELSREAAHWVLENG